MYHQIHYSKIIKEIAHRNSVTFSKGQKIINDFFDEVAKNLIEKKTVVVPKFGKLIPSTRKAYLGINPLTQERMQMPPSNFVHFKIHRQFKKSLNYETTNCMTKRNTKSHTLVRGNNG